MCRAILISLTHQILGPTDTVTRHPRRWIRMRAGRPTMLLCSLSNHWQDQGSGVILTYPCIRVEAKERILNERFWFMRHRGTNAMAMRPVYFTPSFTKTAKTNLCGNIWKLTRYSLHSRLAFFVGSQSFSKYPSVRHWLCSAGCGA